MTGALPTIAAPLGQSPPPSASNHLDDARLLAECVAAWPTMTRVLDIGCGDAAVGIRVATARPDAMVIGIDVERSALERGRSKVRALALDDRVDLRLLDALDQPLPDADVVCCNPPLLPGEQNFVSARGQLFLHAILERLSSTRPRAVFLHVFGFYGILTSTGTQPALVEVADRYGFSTAEVLSAVREVPPTSAIHRRLDDLARWFPLGHLEVNGCASSLSEVVSRSIDPQSVITASQFILRLEYIDV